MSVLVGVVLVLVVMVHMVVAAVPETMYCSMLYKKTDNVLQHVV